MCSKSSGMCELPADSTPSELDQNKNHYSVKSSSSASSSPTSDVVSSQMNLESQPQTAIPAPPPPEFHHRPEPQFFGHNGLLPLDHYRLQLYNYAMVERIRNATAAAQTPQPCHNYPPVVPYGPRLALSMSLFHNRVFQPEEPKPQHSYIGLIAIAILSNPEHKLVLSDIYQHILDNYPYFRNRGPGWRNSIRHNLSLNDCFIKAGRSANGKGHYWAIHPANLEDFKKGDFRRRKAQRKVRKHMGLAVDEDGNDSPSPPPLSLTPPPLTSHVYHPLHHHPWTTNVGPLNAVAMYSQSSRKRQFDVASLLAPDEETNYIKSDKRMALVPTHSSPSPPTFIPATIPDCQGSDFEEDIDVVANDDQTEEHRTNAIPPIGSPKIDSERKEPWLGFPVDPRLLGRYYGQYMAAAHHRATNKRLHNPSAERQSSSPTNQLQPIQRNSD